MVDDGQLEYYAERADNYEDIYDLDKVQGDYEAIESVLADQFDGRDVLEVACGTGYWTRALSDVADSIVGVDANQPVLRRARSNADDADADNAHFVRGDAYTLGVLDREFTAGLAGLWVSHVPRERLTEFFRGFHDRLAPGSPVCLFDNRHVEAVADVVDSDEHGNTYERRRLDDGTEHTILKNYLTEDDLREALPPDASDVEFSELSYLWRLTYRVGE